MMQGIVIAVLTIGVLLSCGQNRAPPYDPELQHNIQESNYLTQLRIFSESL